MIFIYGFLVAKYLHIVQKFITFFIENIFLVRIKGVPLRHESKTKTKLYRHEA